MLYPLRFRPIFKHYVWGGNRLADLLGKPVPSGQTCAESWEIVDRRPPAGDEQSIVEFGPLAGRSLRDLVDQHSAALLGIHAPQRQFPLLVKFLDAQAPLSVQIHPDDQTAQKLGLADCGKTEAWIVLYAEPGARIYAGVKPGVDRQRLLRDIERGTCETALHSFQPKPGDCVFVPAGLIHALGAGLVVAEVQQPSDTTYRLFDWNRLGADGSPRPLHLDQALACLNEALGAGRVQIPRPTDRSHVVRLVQCDKFILDRCNLTAEQALGGDRRAHIVIVVEGAIDLAGDPGQQPLKRGHTALLPAECGSVAATPRGAAVLLDAYLP